MYGDHCNWFTTGHVGKVIIEGYNDGLTWNWKTWNVDIIENHQTRPATLDEFTEEQYQNILVYVPLEPYEDYRTAPIWEKFKNLKGIDYSSLSSVYSNRDITISGGTNQIVIANAPTGADIHVYSIDGQQVATAKTHDVVTALPIPTGIYLVTVTGEFHADPAKVIVR